MSNGVYEIWIGPYFYQGSSKHLDVRLTWHSNALHRNNHPNRKMQNVFNKYKTLQTQILVECEPGLEKAYEKDYIEANWGDKHCLNLNRDVFHPDRTGAKHKPESIQKMKDAHRGKIPWNKGKTGIGGYTVEYVTVKCPHCEVEGRAVNMKRWHFDNCRKK